MAYSIFGFVCYKEASVQGVIKLQTWRFSVQFKISQNKEVPSIFYSEDGKLPVDTTEIYDWRNDGRASPAPSREIDLLSRWFRGKFATSLG